MKVFMLTVRPGRAHLTGRMGDHLIGDVARITPDAGRIHLHGAVEASELLSGW